MSVFGTLRTIAKGESTIDFVGRAKTWFLISLTLVVISLSGLLIKKLNLGLAFEGGSSFSVPIAAGLSPSVADIESAVEKTGVGAPKVQIARSASGVRNIRVETADVEDLPPVVEALAKIAGQDTDEVSVQDVGPTWGEQISRKALRALIVFLIAVIIYISLRFEPKMALCAIVSLIHDLLISVGIYALVGFEVTPATVVAYLTILGYSLYDSVVVFDKVRENSVLLTGTSRMTYSEMVNKSVNQTAMRSINTSLSSLLPVGGLLFVGVYLFGADTLKDLALSLFIGIGVGSYSSIFLGPPLLAILKEREPRYKALRSKARVLTPAGAGAAGGTVAFDAGGEVAQPSESAEPARAPMRAPAGPVQPRGRKMSRKKRRR